MKSTRTYASLLVLAVAAILIAAACGGGGDPGADASAPGGGSTAATTVAVAEVDGVGDVLVDAGGAALYAADQEASGDILCVEACAAIWEPLEPGGDAPTADADVSGEVGVVTRPDGTRQVALDGKPLYRFTEDGEPGVVTGNGFVDTFDGREFTWHVATPDGVSASSDNSSTGPFGY